MMDPPYPYILAAGLRNLGAPLSRATLVVAWLDESGRVVWLEQAPVAAAYRSIPHDGRANFEEIRADDPAIGPRLINLDKMYWVVGE